MQLCKACNRKNPRKPLMKQGTERRNYYRIDDTIGLSYRQLNTADSHSSVNPSHKEMPLTALLAEIDREFNQTTNLLWQENPLVAQALGLLNKKLSMVAALNLSENSTSIDSYENIMVNISGCGMAFDSPSAIEPSTRLALTIVLKPANSRLEMLATVVDCTPINQTGEDTHRIRVQFLENGTAQEELIQHIVQRQWSTPREP
ncbi:MAG: hypothetical protein CMK45_08560 [Porticoccus sp.]|nr:hypothetical protein [Porticoccus sp.]